MTDERAVAKKGDMALVVAESPSSLQTIFEPDLSGVVVAVLTDAEHIDHPMAWPEYMYNRCDVPGIGHMHIANHVLLPIRPPGEPEQRVREAPVDVVDVS